MPVSSLPNPAQQPASVVVGKRKIDALLQAPAAPHEGLIPPMPQHGILPMPSFSMPTPAAMHAFAGAMAPGLPPTMPFPGMFGPPAARVSAVGAIKLLIDGHKVSAIVEKAGCGLKQLREASGARIDIHREPFPGGERLLCIRPPMDAALRCLELLCPKLINAPPMPPPPVPGGSAARGEPVELALRLLLPSASVGRMVGKGGVGLKTLRERHGIAVDLMRDGVGTDRLLTLSGAMGAVYAAACDALALVGGDGVPPMPAGSS